MFSIISKLFATDKVENSVHWARVVMNRETKNLIQQLDYHSFSALEISGHLWKAYPFKTYKSLYFPEFDICEMKLDAQFDLIIAEQVFEHLLKPHHAGRNIYSMLNPNGYFLITTPFLIKIHEEPNDCTRWSIAGLKYLLTESGFSEDKLYINSWGNRSCVISNFERWEKYRENKHSLVNEPNFPVVVWALAQK